MSNNLFYQLARDSLKHNKSRTITSIISAVIIIVILCSTSIIFDSFNRITILEKEKQYGDWNIGISDALMSDIDKEYDYDQAGNIVEFGISASGHSVGMIDKSALQLCKITVSDGIFPKNQDQVAVTIDYLKANGYTSELNQMINLSYYDSSNNLIEHEVQLCGILNDDNLNAGVNIPMVIMKYDNAMIENNHCITILKNAKLNGERKLNYIINDAITISARDAYLQRVVAGLLYTFTLIISGVILYGTTVASLDSKKQEYVLLRGIGATQKQLKKIIRYESLIILIIAISIGLLISFGFSYIVMWLSKLDSRIVIFDFTWSSILWRIVTGAIIFLFATLQPLYRASKHALSGAFSNQEFKYFETRFKKLRKQNCFYLAFRELRTNKKVVIFLILVLAAAMNRTTRIGYDYQQLKTARQRLQKKDYRFEIINNTSINEKTIELLANHSQEVTKFHYQPYQVDSNYSVNLFNIVDQELKSDNLTGSLPVNANEVVLVIQNYDDEYDRIQSEQFYQQYGLGDEILLDSNDESNRILVKIVGAIKLPQYLGQGGIKVIASDQFFSTYEMELANSIQYVTCMTDNYRDYIQLQELLESLSSQDDFMNVIDNHLENQLKYDADRDGFIESLAFVLLILLISFFLFYYINRLTLMANRYELGILKSAGASNKQLYRIQIYKCLIISFIASILSQWSLVYELYNQTGNFDNVLNQSQIIILGLLIIVGLSVIAVILPLKRYTKLDIIELIGRYND